jgi:hypothetical protein
VASLLGMWDAAQSNPALGLEKSLQEGVMPPVLVGVPEQLGREEDVVRVELPELLSGDGGLSDPQLEGLGAPAQVTFQVSYEDRLKEAYRFASDGTASGPERRSPARHARAYGLCSMPRRQRNASSRPPATPGPTAKTQSRVESTTKQRSALGSALACSSQRRGLDHTTDPIGEQPLRALRRCGEGSPGAACGSQTCLDVSPATWRAKSPITRG